MKSVSKNEITKEDKTPLKKKQKVNLPIITKDVNSKNIENRG